VVDRFPFEVTEFGWGEFEIVIKIYFHDVNEKPVELYHPLRLFPPEGVIQPKKKPVVAEQYDEIVFNDPTESMYKKLKKYPTNPTARKVVQPHTLAGVLHSQFDEQLELQKFAEARKKVACEVEKWEEKLLKIEEEIATYSSENIDI
jgi:YEATS domain-containing protein 4